MELIVDEVLCQLVANMWMDDSRSPSKSLLSRIFQKLCYEQLMRNDCDLKL
jgi:hypothetical protein